MNYNSASREWLIDEIEAFFGNEMDLSECTTEEIQELYESLPGDMFNY